MVKKKLDFPPETVRIFREYSKALEYLRKHGKNWILLRDFIQFLQDEKVLEVTSEGLYKIKDGVELVYED